MLRVAFARRSLPAVDLGATARTGGPGHVHPVQRRVASDRHEQATAVPVRAIQEIRRERTDADAAE
jgi:hypothetical protein